MLRIVSLPTMIPPPSFLSLSLSLIFSLSFFIFCLSFFLNRPVYSFLRRPHSTLPGAGCSYFDVWRTVDPSLRQSNEKRLVTKNRAIPMSTMSSVSLYCDCFFFFSLFLSLFLFFCYETHARANFVLSPTPVSSFSHGFP